TGAAYRPAIKNLAKTTASTIAEPIAGKYQKRSARTVGRTTGMLETGKYETTIHIVAKATRGTRSHPATRERRSRRESQVGSASRRRARTRATITSTVQARTGMI